MSVFVAFAVLLLLLSILLFAVGWLSGLDVSELRRGQFTGAQLELLVRTTVSAGTLLAGIFAITYAYRKQRIDEAGSFRADAQLLQQRFEAAASQLGHEKTAVRLAGVYALARLADDWLDKRQMCVDLLCGYLRLPYEGDPSHSGEREVRESVWHAMSARMKDPEASDSWCDLRFDFAGATLDGVQLHGCRIRGGMSFANAVFMATPTGVFFTSCVFESGVSFFQAKFEGTVAFFDDCSFVGTEAFFGGCSFVDSNVFFRRVKFEDSEMYFGGMEIGARPRSELNVLWFDDSEFRGSDVDFGGTRVTGSATVGFRHVKIISGRLDLSGVGSDAGSRRKAVRVEPMSMAPGVLKLPDPLPDWFEYDTSGSS